jgi:NAD(P)-dependent dehydrogenase (short-subunit alcohol dehydrogenase family)
MMSGKDGLKNSVVIVTGGSSGYGAGIAETLARSGARVIITGRDQQRLDNMISRLGGLNVEAIRADASSAADWDRVMEAIKLQGGRLDLLVNNAGEGVQISPAWQQTDAAIEQSIASNLTGAILGSCRAAEIMKDQRDGLIINVGSVCAKHAWPGWSVYSAAKAGLLQFTRCLLTELRPYNVRATSLIPSWGQTDFIQAANLEERPADIVSQCISPRDMGNLVLQIACLPSHLVTEETTIWPMIQPINQL